MGKPLLFAFFALAVFSSCTKKYNLTPPKTDTTKNQVHGFDVYVLGQCGVSQNVSVGGYWKNGVFKALTDTNTGSYARSMTVSGSDVYVAGYYFLNGTNSSSTCAYWKNGTLYPMEDAAVTSCVAVKGSDLYVGGASYNGVPKATYWKNGVKHVLDYNFYSWISAIYIKGNDVYMVGWLGDQMGYWLNDKFITTAAISGNDAYGLRGSFLDVTDIYLCGSAYYNNKYVAAYWRNGTFIYLDNIGSQATGVKISGTDIYCSAFEPAPTGVVNAYYWKNDSKNKLDNSACATDIAIDDIYTDIYVSGYRITTPDLVGAQAVYWLNGFQKKLPNPYYKANSPYTASFTSQILLIRY